MKEAAWSSPEGAAWWLGGATAASGLVAMAVILPSPLWTLALPAALLAGLVIWKLRHPLLAPVAIVFGMLALLGNTPSVTPQEIGYSLALVSYLGWFYATRLLVLGGLRIETVLDKAVAMVVVTILLGFVPTLVFRGDMALTLNALVGSSVLALYFPFREACIRHPKGLTVLLVAFLVLCTIVAINNLLQYRTLLTMYVMPEFVAGRRVTTNDIYFTSGFALSTALLARSENRRVQVVLVVQMALFIGALIATQARSQWVACLVIFGLVFLAGRRYGRVRLAGYLGGVVALGAVLLPLVLGSKTLVLLWGMARRFNSIRTASRQDISLLSRFVEAKAAFAQVLENPILGHGHGVTYPHYDIINQVVMHTSYVHVGYVGLFYTYGLLGGLAVFTAWWSALWRGALLAHIAPNRQEGAIGLGAAAFLASLFLSMLATDPFVMTDGLFVFAMLAALLAGSQARLNGQVVWQLPRAPSVP
ncbi:MAG: O-antigen ligase family protein [Rhodothermales bacterium]|nr:O-antigen ligase family protein [Rhodothermales bacterium]